MRLRFWQTSNAAYVPLRAPHSLQSGRKCTTIDINAASISLLVLLLLLSSIFSFLAGQHMSSKSPRENLRLMPSPYAFTFNQIFAERPNITTDKAWLDLFPTQGGFFKHPDLAPNRSTFAVFHQLHCLDGIRRAYWMLLDITLEGKKSKESELPHHARLNHVRHCIDLLRQALICQPDLTVEVQNDDLGGVTGFGTEHTCVNWNQLVEWVSEWENYDQTIPSDAESDWNGHHGGHG